MPSADVDTLLKPISEAEPCGPDLRYDGRFMQVLRDAEGKPEDPFNNQPAEDPNWREVRDGALEVAARTRDLRVAVVLAVSEAKLDGFPGVERGLRYLRGCVEQYWDTVHPQLDPEDNLDPVMRANTLAALSAPVGTFGDTVRFIERVRALPLCESRQLGRYSLEDFALATGNLTLPEGSSRTKPELTVIEAAFQETDLEKLEGTLACIEKAVEHVKSLESAFNAKVKPGQGLEMSGLHRMLSDALAHLRRHVAARTGAPLAQDTAEASITGGGTGASSGGNSTPGFSVSGAVRSPQDVLVALDAICQYYDRSEPSSPVSLIMRCARQCVGKNFLALCALVKPDAVNMLKEISEAGQAAEQSSST